MVNIKEEWEKIKSSKKSAENFISQGYAEYVEEPKKIIPEQKLPQEFMEEFEEESQKIKDFDIDTLQLTPENNEKLDLFFKKFLDPKEVFPEGQRHSIIEKNFAIYIIKNKIPHAERKKIKEAYEAKGFNIESLRSQLDGVLNGTYGEDANVNVGELINWCKKNRPDLIKVLKKKKEKEYYLNRYVDEDKEIIVEQVYDHSMGESKFCVYNNKTKEIKYIDEIEIKGIKYLCRDGEELEKKAVLLPSRAEDYNDDELDIEIKDFVFKWLDVPEDVIKFGIWNTKRSWVYDKFHSLNYLRALGDTGLGKSRYLNTFGVIHYTPIFTTGATTPAPLFRILDKWGGTLVMDEADLKESDESQDIIKIINQGFEKGNFIMRCDQNDASKISFFDPYSPKILATRRTFKDKATESRCITHVMSVTEREDIPVNLNKEFYDEGLLLRNKLLMWRFRNYFKIDMNKKYDLGKLEPRVKQIVSSYVALFSNNEKSFEEFKIYIKDYQEDLIDERQQSFEGSIIGAIHSLLNNQQINFTAKDIIDKGEFTGRTGKPMNPRALNSYLKSLGFAKSEQIRVDGRIKRVVPIDKKILNNLFERYGFDSTDVPIVPVVTVISHFNNNKEKGVKST